MGWNGSCLWVEWNGDFNAILANKNYSFFSDSLKKMLDLGGCWKGGVLWDYLIFFVSLFSSFWFSIYVEVDMNVNASEAEAGRQFCKVLLNIPLPL